MNFIKNLFLPTSDNKYRARLISSQALILYSVVLILTNFFLSPSVITKTFAALEVNEIVKLHNYQREIAGLPSLTFNPILAKSAQEKGKVMLEHDCWSHYCPEGVAPWEFFKEAQYNYVYAGENLAEGFTDNEIVMQAWMNSKTHRENVLKSQFTEVGIAIVYGDFQGIKNNAIVVVHFGTPLNYKDLIEDSNGDEATSDSELTITNPENNSSTNQTQPIISGNSQEDIEVSVGTQNSGRIIPNGGLYTYKPPQPLEEGEHIAIVKSQSQSSQTQSKFEVDLTPPSLSNKNLKLTQKYSENFGESVQLEYTSADRLASLNLINKNSTNSIGTKISETSSTDSSIFLFKLPLNHLSVDTEISATDFAGNVANIKLGNSYYDILDAEKNAPVVDLKTTPSLGILGISGWDPNYSVFGLVVILFIVFINALFAIDVLIKKFKYKNLNIENIRGNSNFHLASFFILLLVVLVGNFSGSI